MNALAFKIAQLLRSHNYDIRLETNFTDASLKGIEKQVSLVLNLSSLWENRIESDTYTVKSFDEDGYQSHYITRF